MEQENGSRMSNWMNEWTTKLGNEHLRRLVGLSVKERTNEPFNQPADGPTDQLTYQPSENQASKQLIEQTVGVCIWRQAWIGHCAIVP